MPVEILARFLHVNGVQLRRLNFQGGRRDKSHPKNKIYEINCFGFGHHRIGDIGAHWLWSRQCDRRNQSASHQFQHGGHKRHDRGEHQSPGDQQFAVYEYESAAYHQLIIEAAKRLIR
jgi:hypothetical protein